ncbi:MAG: DUF4350 domain-containing protein [Chitinophagaceae bacterium]
MKKYRFYIIIGILLVLYILLTIFKPKKIDWTVTLERKDKNPYGTYILYHQLKDIFPDAKILADQLPAYNQLSDTNQQHSAYLLIAPQIALHKEDVNRLLHYVSSGNEVFIAAYEISKALSDTLKFEMSGPVQDVFRKDSAMINFTNPLIKSDSGYYFRKFTLNNYFTKIDTARTEVLGMMDKNKPDFIRMRLGKGYLYLHSAPLCFSNYFMLFNHNDQYTASALSYLPRNEKTIYWDEYYKLGTEYAGSIMSYFLTHLFLKWAWWIAIFTILMYLLFASKRRQRVIPELDFKTNTSLDFVKTVGNVYFNKQDNKNIAEKKITYFLENIRTHLYLPTASLNSEFISKLSIKSGISEDKVKKIIDLIIQVRTLNQVSDKLLLQLNYEIEDFYKNVIIYGERNFSNKD